MRYDAFISYRHGELDGLVAERLHKMLETYRIPRALAKKLGKKKLSRIFRDREELPTSSNLSDSINEALENSAFLLLICSRRTRGSQWVMREVEIFGKLRGKDKIITLLIDGEPDESFPPGLREREVGGETIFVEPLAADIRAATPRQSIKLLKEEKLRLLAPVLGCAFDDLRRRHRRRRIRRIASAVIAAFAFVLSFGAFSTWQYVQIDREMQQKLENQSYVLAEYAVSELANGDPDMAIMLALEALPEDLDKPERPFVPAAQKALSDALGVYDLQDGFKPHRAVSLSAAPGRVMLSPDERLAATVSPFELTVFDTESGSVLVKLPTARSALADAAFLDDDVVIFAGENGLEAYDVRGGETLWTGEAATAVAVSGDSARIAAVYGAETRAVVYDRDGRVLSRMDFGGRSMRVPADDSFLNPRDAIFALDQSGGRLAVSFSDGSLSVFDTDGGAETVVYPESNATHFAGGFCKNMLAFALVEREPYASHYFVHDMPTGETLAHFSSDSYHFVPCAADGGLYIAFEDQVLSVNTNAENGGPGATLLFSEGGSVETLQKHGDVFLVCESAGQYRFVDAVTGADATYSSDYTCNFTDIGAHFALTGGYDSKVVRILKKAAHSETDILSYASDYEFSEAKINKTADRAAFYSYKGLRLCDLAGGVIAEVAFPEPLSVTDTQHDKTNGNIAVIYEDAFRLYSGVDASLLLEKRGKQGVKSVIYTNFGVSVLDEDGTATLYDAATGETVASADTGRDADHALPIGGGLVTVGGGRVFFGARELGQEFVQEPVEAELIGAGETGDGNYAFAISDGTTGSVFFARDGELTTGFTFPVRGRAEVYFAGGYVFVSPLHGDATAYTYGGAAVRTFSENGYMAEIGVLGGYIYADYVSADAERYALLLTADTLETAVRLPGFLGASDEETVILDDGNGTLRAAKLRDARELIEIARNRLAGRTLTQEEMIKYKAG
jgi:hypothetical protein